MWLARPLSSLNRSRGCLGLLGLHRILTPSRGPLVIADRSCREQSPHHMTCPDDSCRTLTDHTRQSCSLGRRHKFVLASLVGSPLCTESLDHPQHGIRVATGSRDGPRDNLLHKMQIWSLLKQSVPVSSILHGFLVWRVTGRTGTTSKRQGRLPLSSDVTHLFLPLR